MTENMSESGEFKFSIDSSLLVELGERLVTKPSIALAELVKNAYDADATKVTITFEKITEPAGIIIIEDNGHGMTFEEIQNNWMRIATTRKRDDLISRIYCRPLTGAKGIGRLAVRRLGSKLLLQSIAKREDGIKESVLVTFDWEKSFSSGEDLVDIPILYTKQEVPNDSKTGVSLFIENIRDVWTKNDILELRRDILSIQTPFPELTVKLLQSTNDQYQPDPGFDFELVINDFDNTSENFNDFSESLAEAFLNLAWAKLEGKIDEAGKAHYSIALQKSGEQDYLFDSSNDYRGLEKANFRIFYFIYRKEFFDNSGFRMQDATKKGQEEGGVKLYLNGFRVFPYGSQRDDWLRLDEYAAKNINLARVINPTDEVRQLTNSLARPFLLIPRNNQLFGVVSISQTEHSDIETSVTRESLIENFTVENLRRFVQNGIYWMTLKYAAYLAERRLVQQQNNEKNIIQIQTVPNIIEDIKAIITNQTGLPEERRFALIERLDNAAEQARIKEEERISEISMLRILASAGTTLALMNHQLQALVGAISQSEQDLYRLRAKIPETLLDQYDDITSQISEWHEMVELQVSQLGFLLSSESRQRRRRHAFFQVVENVRKPMSFYMNKYGILFENNVSRTLRTPSIYQAELYAVLINILSNALKAVFGQSERRVSVEAEKNTQGFYFRMKNTGAEVPADRRESVFKPFVTTSIPNPVLGIGTGLGLTVVRDILSVYNGNAQFVDVESPWKTCIEIFLPDREKTNDNESTLHR